ncbi:MAG: GAF domain-containing protein, partial [Gammaproteobacteria bacterium]|nr:GAF domain-containing protein [Gammaproteobacteria bacterium]
SGMQDITQAIVGDYALNDILVMILETLFRGLGFSRVLLCIRDAKRGRMVARFGLGRDLESLVNRFSFPLNSGRDVFSRAVQEHDDVVCHEPGKADDVPEWHRALVKPATFALYPIVVNEVTLGLIYADREEADKLVDHFDRNYLNALRNQAALAVKQRS